MYLVLALSSQKYCTELKKEIATRKFEAMEPRPYEEKPKALDCGKVVN